MAKKVKEVIEKKEVKLKSELYNPDNRESIEKRENESNDAIMWGFVLGFVLFFILVVMIIIFTK